jgi:hypothetical protein
MVHHIKRRGRARPRLLAAAVIAVVGLVAGTTVARGWLVTPAAAEVLSGWHYRDLSSATGASLSEPVQIAAFQTDGGPRTYYVDRGDNIQELAWYGNSWHRRNLTALMGTPPAYDYPGVAGFPLPGIGSRLYYQDRSSHIHELDLTSGVWRHRDLTAETGAPVEDVISLTAFALSPTNLRVYYIARFTGHVHELAYSGSRWSHKDLTATTNATAAIGKLAAFPINGRDVRLYYVVRDPSRHVHELDQTQGVWRTRDITADAGAPAARGLMVSGFHVGGADSRIYYEDVAQHLHELSYSQGGWHHRDINVAAGFSQIGYQAIAGYRVGTTGNEYRVYALGPNFFVHEFAYSNNAWHHTNVTREADAPGWNSPGGFVAFPLGGADTRIYYTNGDSHIHELAFTEEVEDPEEPDPGKPDPGVKRLDLYNCHTERRPLEIWVEDLSAGDPWMDLGRLDHQWGDSGPCPATGSPFTFNPPVSGHVYHVAAVDFNRPGCTNSPILSSACRKLESWFRADSNGVTLSLLI